MFSLTPSGLERIAKQIRSIVLHEAGRQAKIAERESAIAYFRREKKPLHTIPVDDIFPPELVRNLKGAGVATLYNAIIQQDVAASAKKGMSPDGIRESQRVLSLFSAQLLD